MSTELGEDHTSAQFALRHVATVDDSASLHQRLLPAKMLSFSDSFSDMEQLAQDFDDPERHTFVEQAIVEILSTGERTLRDLQREIFDCLRIYGQKLQGEGERAMPGYDWVQHFSDADVWDEVLSQLVSGYYTGMGSQQPRLVRAGIANVRLDTDVMVEDEKQLLRSLAQRNNRSRTHLRSSLVDAVVNFDQTLEDLRERGHVEVRTAGRREIVSLNPEKLVCYLVDDMHPIMRTTRGRFLSDLEHRLGVRSADENKPLALRYDERIDPQSEEFSYVAYRIAYTSPLLLRSEVYKGDVDKKTRRRIEHAFKYGADIHFLSSGPAMEVGIDIGDLNLLLLYGTPPNVNNYLQRIGRAGRRAKRSLVLSVSKRNPIDYYYYRNPRDLITSSAQPVPLNEFNEEALRVSLTWALLDYVAGRFWIPWQRERTPDGDRYTDGQDFRSILEPRPNDVLRLLRMVFSVPSRDIGYGQPLQTLSTIVHDRQDEARNYLVSLLDHRVCSICKRYIARDAVHCSDPQCDGVPILLSERYADLIDEALEQFSRRMVDFVIELRKELRRKRRRLTHQRDDIEDELDETTSMSEGQHETMSKLERVEGRLRAIEDLLLRLDRATMVEAQQFSPQSRYTYQIRAGSDAVEIVRYEMDAKGQVSATPRPSRDMGMAIKEYHPYAVILSGRQSVFTRAVGFDTYATEEMKNRLENTPWAEQPLACPSCGSMYDASEDGQCTCGAALVRMELQVLQQAETQPLKMALSDAPDATGSKLYPSAVFRGGDTGKRVSRTYSSMESQVVEFVPTTKLEVIDDVERPVGMLEFGDLELATFANGCSVTYVDGSREPLMQLFTICGEESCNGVVVHSTDTRFCALDPRHDVSRGRIVRLGYLFRTQGLRLQLYQEPWAVTHSLAHGFRVALEKIGGLSVRNISELVDERQGIVYVYDAIPGGAGVTELLVRMQGGVFRHFGTALEVIRGLVQDCECVDGCPHCLYQYGCHNWNKPGSLSRHSLWAFLTRGIQLRMVEGKLQDERLEPALATEHPGAPLLLVPSFSPEGEERQRTWQLICELERQLRTVIEDHYHDQFGESWLDRVPEPMRQSWQRPREQDARAFSQYDHPEPGPLDYTYLGDLLVLINGQWQLFGNVFGTGKPAKRELRRKLEAIIKSRNPLAHNRAVPENELRRAEVYCTDLLMQIGPSLAH